MTTSSPRRPPGRRPGRPTRCSSTCATREGARGHEPLLGRARAPRMTRRPFRPSHAPFPSPPSRATRGRARPHDVGATRSWHAPGSRHLREGMPSSRVAARRGHAATPVAACGSWLCRARGAIDRDWFMRRLQSACDPAGTARRDAAIRAAFARRHASAWGRLVSTEQSARARDGAGLVGGSGERGRGNGLRTGCARARGARLVGREPLAKVVAGDGVRPGALQAPTADQPGTD